MTTMKYLMLTLAILLAPAISQKEANLMPILLNLINNATTFYERYILRANQVYWKLSEKADAEYDFIIIGSGSAGAVIASRLTEIPGWKVLLLEAGEAENSFIDVPMLAATMQGSRYDWAYKTVKLTNMSLGYEDHVMRVPRGKALGGCSVLNYMMYCRGNKWDYENWAAMGNPGWSYKDVLPYFLKSEAARLEVADYRYHNTDGYLSVEDVYQSKLVDAVLKGGEEIGLPYIDYNAPTKSFGVAPIQTTVHNGRRDSVAKAFLRPTTSRDNLHILAEAFVRKILINDKNEAYAVQYERKGKNYTVRARKEVILSAGTVNTPQILMLSGIGPKEHLEELGIECLKDLPVGQNLQDHLTFYGLVYLILYDIDQSYARYIGSVPDYVFRGKGPLTSIGAIQAVGYVKTDRSKVKVDQPDIEYMFLGGSLAASVGTFMETVFGMKQKVYDSMFFSLQTGYQWTIAPVLLHPKSKGYIKLKSKDPHDPPLIDPRYYTDPKNEDIKTMIAGIRQAQKLGQTRTWKEHGATLNDNALLGCDKTTKFDSDEYWECVLRSISNTLYHIIGTAKMGPKDDPTSVVDHHLHLHGIDRLRVADCSIIPSHISGHTNAAAIMIAEKVSDLIKMEWGESVDKK